MNNKKMDRLRWLAKHPYRSIVFALGFIEKLLLPTGKPEYPPIFIVGCPRSGTTLLYQLMCHRFHLAYISNVAAAFYTTPVLASRLSKGFLAPYRSDFRSNYGRTGGLSSPHEGKIWRRWFSTKIEEVWSNNEVAKDSKKKLEIQSTVAGIEKVYEAPFINKDVYNTVRIRALVDIFPMAVFLQLKRDPIQVALEILNGRKKHLRNINEYWSVMPREEMKFNRKNHLEQIAGQVYFLERDIEEDAKYVGWDRFYTVDYRRLCENPRGELYAIESFLESRHSVPLRKKFNAPISFRYMEKDMQSLKKEESELAEEVGKYYVGR